MKSRAGFSLVEAILAIVILSIVALGVAQAFSYYYRDFARAKNSVARDRYLHTILATLEVRMAQMDFSFDPAVSMNKDFTTFPYYWSAESNGWLTKQECIAWTKTLSTNCALLGRLNFMIKPVLGVPNMFETTVYMYHPELNEGKVREYKYFLAVK